MASKSVKISSTENDRGSKENRSKITPFAEHNNASPVSQEYDVQLEEESVSTVTPTAILIPRKYQLKEGSELYPGTFIGRLLGAGMQAKVYDLVDAEGAPTGQVVKIAHDDAKHAVINAVWISLEREWEIGVQLRAALQEPDGSLPGYMAVLDCLIKTTSKAGKNKNRKARFGGMILERLNGWEVYKRIDTPTFHNIHYVREMLYQVFSALDKGQRQLGFSHADLGFRNIMEHYPSTWESLERAEAVKNKESMNVGSSPELEHTGSSNAYEMAPGATLSQEHPPSVEVSKTSVTEGRNNVCTVRPRTGCQPIAPRVGWSVTEDGSRLPLGPHLEFKIIDYGVAMFDDLLAQTTGGFEAEETSYRLRGLFTKNNLLFGSPSRKGVVEIDTVQGMGGFKKETWRIKLRNRFQRVKQTPSPPSTERESPTTEFSGELSSTFSSEDQVPIRLQSLQPMDAETRRKLMDEIEEARRLEEEGEGETEANDTESNLRRVTTLSQAHGAGLVEKMYRSFWSRKSDVFHLLLGLAISLDNRVWPKEDEKDVLLLISLVHHVTGIKMSAHFAYEKDIRCKALFGRYNTDKDYDMKKMCKEAKRRRKLLGLRKTWRTFFRRMHIRLKAHFRPYNSGLTAGEALVSPFFGKYTGKAPMASLPVCIETAFPRVAGM